MIYTVFDVEATGLYKFNKLDIIQCAYIRLNNDFQPIRSEYMYYYHDNMDWSQEAEDIHHISQDFLKEHKDEFFDNLKRMYVNLNNTFFITFNGDKYDIPLTNNWLHRMTDLTMNSLGSYDVMKIYGKAYGRNPSLVKACEKEDISSELIQAVQKQLFGVTSGAHDATYDSVATFLLFKKAITDGKVTLRPVTVSLGEWSTEPEAKFFRIASGDNISYICTSSNTRLYDVLNIPEEEVEKVISTGEFKNKHLSPELVEKLIISNKGNLILYEVSEGSGIYEQAITETVKMVVMKTMNSVSLRMEAV